jgi:hypothetical protein
MAMTYLRERMQNKAGEGKWHMGMQTGRLGASFQNPLPRESRGTCVIPSGVSCDNTCEMLSPGKLTSVHTPKFQMEYNVPNKPNCFYKLFRHNSLSPVEEGWWEPSQNPSLQTPQGSRSQTGFSMASGLGHPAVLTLFLESAFSVSTIYLINLLIIYSSSVLKNIFISIY